MTDAIGDGTFINHCRSGAYSVKQVSRQAEPTADASSR
jgi:hypothetical protein